MVYYRAHIKRWLLARGVGYLVLLYVTYVLHLTLTALGGWGGLGGPPRQILPCTLNRCTSRRAISWVFSLKPRGYFDTKFAKIGPPITESHDLLWPKVNPKSEIFSILCTKPMAKWLFTIWAINHYIFLFWLCK